MNRPALRIRWTATAVAVVSGTSLLVALALVTGCQEQAAGGGGGPAATKVQVTAVTAGDYTVEVELAATIEGLETAQLMSKIDGYVDEVRVDIGDPVNQGQILAVLRAPDLLDELERRDALVEQAKADLSSRHEEVKLASAKLDEQRERLELHKIMQARYQGLVDQGALQQEKLDEARFAVRSAQAAIRSGNAEVATAAASVAAAAARLAVARAEVKKATSLADYRHIRAPFTGLVSKRLVDPGAFVRPATSGSDTPLFEVVRVDSVRVVVYVPMDMAGQLDRGDGAVLHRMAALPGVRLDGLKITRFSPSLDRNSRMMRAEIDLENAEVTKRLGRPLRPGGYGSLTLTLAEHHGLPTVPSTAIATKGGKSVVYLVGSDHSVREVPVKPRVVDGDRTGLESEGAVKLGHNVVAKDLDRVHAKQTLTAASIERVDSSVVQ